MRYLIALALLASPAMAADLPPPEALAPVKTVVAKPPARAILTKGKGRIVITCAKTCLAVRTENGVTQKQDFGRSTIAKLVKEARGYGWKN